MSCCNKYYSIIGIIIGSIYTLFFLMVFIESLYSFLTTKDMSIKYEHESPRMLMSSMAALISALYVLAIVKKYPKLIIPWLLLCIPIFLLTCFFIFVHFYGTAWHGASNYLLITILVIGACVLGIEIAIFWLSCCLYLDIHEENYTRAQNNSRNNSANFI